MKKYFVFGSMVLLFAAGYATGCGDAKEDHIKQAKQVVANNIQEFGKYIRDTLSPVVAQNNLPAIRSSFLKTRLLYKRLEWAVEYFMPTTTRFVNGPPLPEIENEENKIFEPEGLQVMEEILYSGDSIDFGELTRQAGLLSAHARTYAAYWEAVEISEVQIWDAIKLQLFRIASLGLSGFDAALAKSSIPEIASSLLSLKNIVLLFEKGKELTPLFDRATNYTSANTSFELFDRATFIKSYLNPLTRRITLLQQNSVGFINDSRLLKPAAATLFDEDIFDVNAYTQDSFYHFSRAKAELGKRLFNDVVLSGGGERSCAGCHQPGKAFTDGLKTSLPLGKGIIKRNAPSLLNAALQSWQFYDMRTTNLENQSSDVIGNTDEMHGDLAKAITTITNDASYRDLISKAFPAADAISEKHVQNALATYVRSLTALNSRFDTYMRSESGEGISAEEKQGFNLFMGKAKCGSCHFMPLFNGTVPPAFIKMESEVLGVPSKNGGKVLDSDSGRYLIYKLQPYLHAFKTTTVRNAALTAPYMHNGIYNTLEEVVDFYNDGGGKGAGISVDNQTLPGDKLDLSATEKKALIRFIEALTDTASYK